MSAPKPIYSYLAAAALALITIFTFYVFRDFGPQSVIRRFHIDVARQDWNDLDQISVESTRTGPTQEMAKLVLTLIQYNASFEIVGLRRQHGEVVAAVEYRLPNGFAKGLAWHVRLDQNEWKVDCRATWEGMIQQQGTVR